MQTDNPLKRSDGFRVGQRVSLTAYGREQRIVQRRGYKGTVKAIPGPLSIMVQPDGYKHPREYSVNFWEPAALAKAKGRA